MAVRRQPGVALLELLVALAITALVLAVVVRALHHGRQAERAVAEASEARATAALALDQAAQLVSRAGTAPWPRPAVATPPGPGLVLRIDPAASSGDTISVRYLQLDAGGAPVERWFHLDARRDGRGTPTLYRAPEGSVRQPWVEGVERIAVRGWVDAGGVHDRAEAVSGPLAPVALLLEVRVAGEATVAAVPLPGRPVTTVEVAP